MSAPEVSASSRTPFSTPANNLLWIPPPQDMPTVAAAPPKPLLTLSAADYTKLQAYITATTVLPQSYEAYRTLYPDVLSPLTTTNLYSRTGQTLVSTAALTKSYQLSFSEISDIAGALIGFAAQARLWYPRLQTQLLGLDATPSEARQGREWEGMKGAAIMALKTLSDLAERKEERIGTVLARFTSLRSETLPLKTAIQGITKELSSLQDNITREFADRSAKLQKLRAQRAVVEEERCERNRERNRAFLSMGYMFVDPLLGFLTTAATVTDIHTKYESKRRERNGLDLEIEAVHHCLTGLEKATITTDSLECTLVGILSVVDAFLEVCRPIKNTFRTMQTNFDLVSTSLHATCNSTAGDGFLWAIEDLQRACEVWERIAECALEFQSEEFLKVCVRKE